MMNFDFRDYRDEIDNLIDEKVEDLRYNISDCFCYFSGEFEDILEEVYQQGYEQGREENDFSLWGWLKEYLNSPHPKDLKEILNACDPETLGKEELERLLEEANKEEEKVVFALGDEVIYGEKVCVVIEEGFSAVNDSPNLLILLDDDGEIWSFTPDMHPEKCLSKTGGKYKEVQGMLDSLYESRLNYGMNV